MEIEKATKFEPKSPISSSFLPKLFLTSKSSSSLLSPSVNTEDKSVAQSSKDTTSIDIDMRKEDFSTKTSHSFSSIGELIS